MPGFKDSDVVIVVDWDETCTAKHWHKELQSYQFIAQLNLQESQRESVLKYAPTSAIKAGQNGYRESFNYPSGVTLKGNECRFGILGDPPNNPLGGVSIKQIKCLMKTHPLNMDLINILLEAAKIGQKIAITSFTWYPEAIDIALNLLIAEISQDEQQRIRNNITIAGGYPLRGMRETGKLEHFKALGIKNVNLGLYIDDDVNNCLVAKKQFPKENNLIFVWPIPRRLTTIFNSNDPFCKTLTEKSIAILGKISGSLFEKIKSGDDYFSESEHKHIQTVTKALQAFVLMKVKSIISFFPTPLQELQSNLLGLSDMKTLTAIDLQRTLEIQKAQMLYIQEAEKSLMPAKPIQSRDLPLYMSALEIGSPTKALNLKLYKTIPGAHLSPPKGALSSAPEIIFLEEEGDQRLKNQILPGKS